MTEIYASLDMCGNVSLKPTEKGRFPAPSPERRRPGTSRKHSETRRIDNQRSDRLQMDADPGDSAHFYKIRVLIFHFVTNSPLLCLVFDQLSAAAKAFPSRFTNSRG
jgi:hypothetical protein